ncbi:MAG: hypothetical protein AAGI01_11085 [Myxococcota bacterium]
MKATECTQRELINFTNTLIKTKEWSYEWTMTPGTPTKTTQRAVVFGYVRGMVRERLETSSAPEEHFEVLSELLRLLTLKRGSRSERQQRAMEHVVQHAESFFGWEDLLTRAQLSETPCVFQLDRRQAWWRSGEFRLMHEQRLEIEGDARDAEQRLRDAGFELIDQEAYRQRVKHSVIDVLLQGKPSPLEWPARAIVSYTFKQRNMTILLGGAAPAASLDEHEVQLTSSGLRSAWYASIAHRAVAVPHQPLATLPMETNNIGALSNGGTGDEEQPTWRTASLRLMPNPNHADGSELEPEQLLLAYDQRLVRTGSERPDTYISVPVEGHHTDPHTALLQSLQGLGALGLKERQSHMRDVPRVVAGIFRAAAQDARTPEIRSLIEATGYSPGVFIDEPELRRLTRLIGWDHKRKRYRERVARVLDWLQTMWLEREVYATPPVHSRKKARTRTFHRSPLLHKLPDQILLAEEVEGSWEVIKGKRRNTLSLFKLSEPLWQMANPDSSTSSFMLIDQRAFELDTSLLQLSSEPFNLYWCIVQRAYNDARHGRVDSDGTFSPKLKVLYDFSGMEHPSDAKNPSNIRERMRDWLELMIDHGLIVDWRCPFLLSSATFDREAFNSAVVELVLPDSLTRHLDTPQALSS